MNIETLKTYGVLRKRYECSKSDDDRKKLEEIERVFNCILNTENRYIFRLWCLGYSYSQITDIIQKDGLYFTRNTVKSKGRRIIQKLKKDGILC